MSESTMLKNSKISLIREKHGRLTADEKRELLQILDKTRATLDNWFKNPAGIPSGCMIVIRDFLNNKLELSLNTEDLIGE